MTAVIRDTNDYTINSRYPPNLVQTPTFRSTILLSPHPMALICPPPASPTCLRDRYSLSTSTHCQTLITSPPTPDNPPFYYPFTSSEPPPFTFVHQRSLLDSSPDPGFAYDHSPKLALSRPFFASLVLMAKLRSIVSHPTPSTRSPAHLTIHPAGFIPNPCHVSHSLCNSPPPICRPMF